MLNRNTYCLLLFVILCYFSKDLSFNVSQNDKDVEEIEDTDDTIDSIVSNVKKIRNLIERSGHSRRNGTIQ